MQPLELFLDVIYRRKILLKGFESITEDLFHTSVEVEAWSPESLFRHLLTGMKWMSGTLCGDSIHLHPLALMTAAQYEKSSGLKEIKDALNEVSSDLRDQIIKMEDENWNEIIDSPLRGRITRSTAFSSLLFHEVEHLGQIKWILKRLAGWSDSELYAIRLNENEL